MGNAAGRSLPYTPGLPIPGLRNAPGAWSAVLEGTPSSAQPDAASAVPGQVYHARVNIFKFDKKAPRRPTDLALVQNALKRLKSLRHPYILRYVDGGETDDAILVVAESAVPLRAWLAQTRPASSDPPAAHADFAAACVWGVYTLVTALNFLASIDVVHGSVSPDAVWVTRGGDWKLFGFELAFEASGGGGPEGFPDRAFVDLDTVPGPCPEASRAPERSSLDWGPVSLAPRTAMDA
jgi:hypothetical protein